MSRVGRLAGLLLILASSAIPAGDGRADVVLPDGTAMPPGRVVHVAPHGSDTNPGTRDLPWLSWPRALGELRPGDTLVAAAGNYQPAASGVPEIRCDGPHASGTAHAPITIVADPPRQAVLHPAAVLGPAGPTWSALTMRGCAWWRLIGLRFEGSDTSGPDRPENSFGGLVHVTSSNNVELRRLFVRRANRYGNHHLIVVQDSQDVLVEEAELYDFCRHGISVPTGSRITLRRNYANVNFYPTVSGQWADVPGSDCTTGGAGSAFVLYPAANSILENNVSEHSGYGILLIEPDGHAGDGSRNLILGNIGNDNHRDLTVDNRSREQAWILVKDHVAARPRTVALWTTNGVRGLLCENCTLLGGSRTFGAPRGADLGDYQDVEGDRVALRNSLVLAHAFEGIRADGTWAGCTVEFTTVFGNAADLAPPACQTVAFSTSDPNVGEPAGERVGLGEGDCIVYVPLGNSALKATGRLAADRGANVVYRTHHGWPTPWKLWGAAGAFACGTDVLGHGDRCQNVHERLHVGTHGCPLP